jgi:hypothetical protein
MIQLGSLPGEDFSKLRVHATVEAVITAINPGFSDVFNGL